MATSPVAFDPVSSAWKQAEATGDYSNIGGMVAGLSPADLQTKYGLSQSDISYIYSRPGVSTSTPATPAPTSPAKDPIADAWYQAESAGDYSGIGGMVAGMSPTDVQSKYGLSQADIDYIYSRPGVGASEPVTTATSDEVDPYAYAYEYGVANNDFSGLLGLLKQTPDSTQLISQYNLTPEQINQIEFGTGFDLDQSGGYGAGKVGNDWDYEAYLDKLRAGDEKSINEGLQSLASADPLMARNVQSLYDELRAQQKVTGDSWATGGLGSKDAAAMDFALRLTENGVKSIYDLGQRTVERTEEREGGPEIVQGIEYFDKRTGEALPDWNRVAASGPLDLEYNLSFAADGTPIPYTTKEQSDWVSTYRPMLKTVASVAAMANPALAPYVAAGNAVNAASKGDWGTAIVSALTAVPGFNSALQFSPETLATLNTAKTGAQILNAIDKGNPIAIANALAQTSTGKEMLSSDMGGGVTLGNVLDTAKIATSVNAGDYASALNYAGSLTNSPDLRVAGSSAALLNAMKSGDPFKIATAMGQLDKAVKTATKDSGKQAPVEDMKPTSYGTNITKQLSDAGLSEKEQDGSDIFGVQTDEINSDIASVVPRDILVASGDGSLPENFKPIAANQIQIDSNGLPKTIGIFDFNTQKIVPVPIERDTTGKFYYNTPEGATVGVDATAFERAFYKSNPSEYLRIVNEIYANSGDINKINEELAKRGLSESMAEQMRTIDVEAKDVTDSTKTTGAADTKSGVTDFLSKVNFRSALAGEGLEIAAAMAVPEIAKILSAAQDSGYINDIKTSMENATTAGDREYFKSLAQELVAQKPELANDPSILDVLNASTAPSVPDFGTVNIYGKRMTPEEKAAFDREQDAEENRKLMESLGLGQDFESFTPTTTKTPPKTDTQIVTKTPAKPNTPAKTETPTKAESPTKTDTPTKTDAPKTKPPVVPAPVVTPPAKKPPVVSPPVTDLPVTPPATEPPVVKPPVAVPPVAEPPVEPPVVEPPAITPPPVVEPPVVPPVVGPPAAPSVPAKPTTPAAAVNALQQIARTMGVPATSQLALDIFEALYGTMEYLDISEEFEPSARKAGPAATQKQLQQTKMAQGGYLDDLLAENMSADDLLKLLR